MRPSSRSTRTPTSRCSSRPGATTRPSSRRPSPPAMRPDVIEFGNTDTPKYTSAGALAPLTKGDLPELEHVAVRSRGGRCLQRAHVRRPLLRRRPRRHLPDRPVQGRRDHESTDLARRVHDRRQQADGEVRRLQGPDVLGRLLPGTVLVRSDVVRLRPRRRDRAVQERQVGRHPRLAAGAPGPERVADDGAQALPREQDR